MTKEKCSSELYRWLELFIYLFINNLFKNTVSSSGTVHLNDWKGASN